MHATTRSPHRRVVIIGGGCVGAYIASSARPHVPCLVIDPHEDVRSGLQRNHANRPGREGFETHPPDRVPALYREGDVVVLCTSASVAASACRDVPSWAPVICLSNGLTDDLKTQRNGTLSYGVVEFAVSSPRPGHSLLTQSGWLTLERRSVNDAAPWLASIIDPRKQRTRLADDIDVHRRSKLMLNASLDPVAAIIGGSIGDVFAHARGFHAFRTLLHEAVGVARGAGWRLCGVQGMRPDVMAGIFSVPVVGRAAARIAGHKARHVASTLSREVSRGEIGEASNLCGAIVSEGQRRGIATPAHERAMRALRSIASGGASDEDRLLYLAEIGSAA